MSLPEGAPAASTHAADGGAVWGGGEVAGGPIDDFIGADIGEESGLGGVGEDLDVFAEFQDFLAGVSDRAAGGVGDGDLGGDGEDFEGEGEGVLDALEVAGDEVIGGGRWLGEWWWVMDHKKLGGGVIASCRERRTLRLSAKLEITSP